MAKLLTRNVTYRIMIITSITNLSSTSNYNDSQISNLKRIETI